MSMQACRNALMDIVRENGTNAGLLLASYLRVPVKTEQNEQTGQGDHPNERKALFKATGKAHEDIQLQSVYQKAFSRRENTLNKLTSYSEKLTVKDRLIIGLGGENVLETGIALHHTYGTPVIPGSALKGLAAHYCDQVMGLSQQEFKIKGVQDTNDKGDVIFRQGHYHHILFGNNDDCGFITFHDAWIMPECLGRDKLGLVEDVMTPHHAKYYSGESEVPSDFDDPTPIAFLAVAGTFQVFLSCEDSSDEGKRWLGLAMELLVTALENWGIGGKTNAGYGRLVRGNTPVTMQSTVNVSLNSSNEEWSKAKLTWIPGSRKLEAFGGPNQKIASIILPQNDNSIFESLNEMLRNRLLVKKAKIEADVEVARVGNSLYLVRILYSTPTNNV